MTLSPNEEKLAEARAKEIRIEQRAIEKANGCICDGKSGYATCPVCNGRREIPQTGSGHQLVDLYLDWSPRRCWNCNGEGIIPCPVHSK